VEKFGTYIGRGPARDLGRKRTNRNKEYLDFIRVAFQWKSEWRVGDAACLNKPIGSRTGSGENL
jgi:hypothetical protein